MAETGDRRKVRLSLEMAPEVRELLEDLKKRTNADTLAEVVRRALGTYDYLWAEKAKGARVIFRGAEGTERELLIV
jgi:hypothetical protein